MNFMLSDYLPNISCKQVSSDGYEITNLISPDINIRRKGFIVESFIKPPVEVTVQLGCPIELSHIVLNNRIGNQQSVGFEISTQIFGSQPLINLLAKAVLRNEEEQVIFINNNYRPQPPFQLSIQRQRIDITSSRSLRSHLHKALSCISEVHIKIFKTSNSSNVAIGRLEIWGHPSRGCRSEAVQRILQVHKKNTTVRENPIEPKNISRTKNEESLSNISKSESSKNHDEIDPDIPSEFLDPITCDIMVLPVLLPSGQCIDQATLDKYLALESSWGRLPNDPFTGVAFSQSKGPLPHSVLKTRIDAFLLTHEQIANKVGRTTGKKRPNCQAQVLMKQITLPGKRLKIQVEKSHVNGVQIEKDKLNVQSKSDGASTSSLSNHELNLKSSLDLALKTVLGSLHSYTKTRKDKDVTEEEAPSLNFACPHKSDLLFQLPCLHVICRTCLVKKKFAHPMICDKCQMTFDSNGPVRVHL